MTRIIARRDMKRLQLSLAVSVKTNLQLSRKKSEWDADLDCQNAAFCCNANRVGAIHESIHLYLCFADVDRATVRLGG
jgi:hypothetical protein